MPTRRALVAEDVCEPPFATLALHADLTPLRVETVRGFRLLDCADSHVPECVHSTCLLPIRGRNRRVALSVSPLDDPYAHADIRGRVVDIVRGEEAGQHIQRLHQKYRGGGSYPLGPGERRLKVVIEPVAVKVSG